METQTRSGYRLHVPLVIAAMFLALMFVGSSVVTAQTPSITPKSPITMKFSPNAITVPLGSTGPTTSTSTNKDGYTFYVTGCTITINPPTGKKITQPCSVSSGLQVAPGKPLQIQWKLGINSGPTGVYVFKILLTGTMNGAPAQSGKGKVTVTVT